VRRLLLVCVAFALYPTAGVAGADIVDQPRTDKDPTVGPLVTPETLASPVGYWKTIDDKTRKPRSIIKIWEQGGELRGRVERLIREPNEEADPVCTECKGEKRNQKMLGLEFLWGFRRQDAGWSDGWVLDPEEGNTYHATLEVVEGGKKLKLFGYIRILVKIGRSATWERIRPEDLAN
jgi:uncharacterized protein (DUF2147 family)